MSRHTGTLLFLYCNIYISVVNPRGGWYSWEEMSSFLPPILLMVYSGTKATRTLRPRLEDDRVQDELPQPQGVDESEGRRQARFPSLRLRAWLAVQFLLLTQNVLYVC